MDDHLSLVKKTEIEVDDFWNLLKRRKSVAVVLLLVILVPVFGIPALKEKLASKDAELERVTHERDAARSQLAPFLAAGLQAFPVASDKQRLELLLQRLSRRVDEAVKELKNVVVQGSRSLVDNIPVNADWDLEEGSLFLAVTPPEQGASELLMFSKTTEAFLTFTIFPRTVQYKYYHPGLGTLVKEAPIFETDLASERRIIIVAFTWTIAGHQITIDINGHQRA